MSATVRRLAIDILISDLKKIVEIIFKRISVFSSNLSNVLLITSRAAKKVKPKMENLFLIVRRGIESCYAGGLKNTKWTKKIKNTENG